MGQDIHNAQHLDGGLYRLFVTVGVLEHNGAVVAARRTVNGLCLPSDGVVGGFLYLGERILGLQGLVIDGDARVFGLGLRSFGVTHDEHDLAGHVLGLDRQQVCSLLREAHIRVSNIACLAVVFHKLACIRSAVAKLGFEENVHPPIHAEHDNSGDNGDNKHYRKGDN